MITCKFDIHLIPGSAARANIIEIQIPAPAVSFCSGTGQRISLFLDREGRGGTVMEESPRGEGRVVVFVRCFGTGGDLRFLFSGVLPGSPPAGKKLGGARFWECGGVLE